MKKILWILLLLPTVVIGQNKREVDSLKLILKSAKSTLSKSKTYIQLSSILQRSNTNAAKSYLDSANKLNKSIMNDSLLMIISKNYADYYNDGGQPDTAMKYALQAINIANKLNNKVVKATALNIKGNSFMVKRDFKNAQIAYLEAMQIYTALNNSYAIGNLYINIGYLLEQQHLVKEAELQYNEANIIFQKLANKERLAQLYNNYGILYGENNQFSKAERFFAASTQIREKLNDQLALANAYLNLGGINVLLKNYNKAEIYLLKGKKQFEEMRNILGITSSLTNLGELYQHKKNYPKAISYSKEAIKLSKTNKNNEDLENALINLSSIYKDLGDYKTAYQYKEELSNLKDSIYQKSLNKQIAEMQTKYDTQKKEQQITLLHTESIIQKLSISRKNISIGIIIIFFLMSLAFSLLYYNRYKNKQEVRLQSEVIYQQALASKGIIEAEERERKRIAGELHDGVGQLFTTVKMNLEILIERFLIKLPDADLLAERTIALVDESCTEVRLIAHQMMPNALIKSGLVSALRDFINKIPSDKLKISIETKGIDKGLETTTETVLYRVIQESVNNVIKHADATTLDILLLCDEKEITVSIEDNGKGFSMDDKNKFSGIGLKNMISRVEYLKGTVDVSSAPGKGTLVAIYIPLI